MDGEGEVELVSVSLLAFKGEEETSKRLALAFDVDIELVPTSDMNASGLAMAVDGHERVIWRMAKVVVDG